MPGILFRGLNNLRDPFGLYTPQQPKAPDGARVETASINAQDAARAARPRIDGAAEPQKMVREQPGQPAAAKDQPAEAPKVSAPSDLRQYIIETAEDVGIDPLDLATAISYETKGTFDPTAKGPVTQWGQHQGLIQFGEDQARQYGVDWSRPVESQLGKGKAVAKYLRDNGVKPGMGLLDIYSAINAGEVGLHNRSDAKNGGAPGTVADKVANQMAGHRRKAARLLGLDRPQLPEGEGAPTPTANPAWNEPERQFAQSGMRNGALGMAPTATAYAPEAKNPAAKGLARLVRAPEQMDGFAGELKFVHEGQDALDPSFRAILEDVSADIGQPLTIQSGYRSPKHRVEARKKSGPGEHTRGHASDINLAGKSDAERIEIVKKLRARGVNRFITYTSMPDVLHVDMKDQTGTGSAWFMHDKTNRNMHKAPDWFKTAQSEVASIKPGSVPVSTRTAGTARREGLPVRVDFDPKDPMGLYTDGENPLSGYGMPEGADAPVPTPRPEFTPAQGAPDMAGGDEIDAIVGDLNAESPDRFAAMSPEEYLAWKKEFDAQHKSQGAGGDADRLLRRGGAQMGLGIRELVRNVPGGETLLKGTDTIAGWLVGEDIEAGDVDRKMGEISDRATATMTPAQRSASTKEWVSEKTGADGETSYALGPAWSDPRSYVGVLAESLPSTAATMGTSAILARGTYVAAQSAGAGAKQAAAKAATTALVSGSIGEAMISGGQTAAAVREKLASIPRDVLADSDAVRALVSQGMSEDQAIEALTDDAAVKSMVISGVITGAFGGRGDWFMAKVFTEGVEGTLGQRLRSGIAKGIIAEGVLEELPQSVGEQIAQNIGVQEALPDQRLLEGVPNAAAGGLVAGGIMGGGMGAAGSAVSPRGTGMADDAATPEPAPAAEPTPATEPQTDTFVVNAPADPARGIPAEDIHGVTVKRAADQSGVADGMMRVTLPSGEERVVGTALLNGQDPAQSGGVLKRAKTYADSRAPAPANDPGQADQGGGDPGAAGLAGAAGAATAVPAAAAAAPGPGMDAGTEPAERASLPAVGATVTVTDPGLDPFEARVESIEGDEAMVFDPVTGEVYQVALSSIAGATTSPSEPEPAMPEDPPMVSQAEPAAPGEPIVPDEPAPVPETAPAPVDTTQPTQAAPRKPVMSNGKTVNFPDDAHRDVFDHGEKLALGRNSNLSAAKVQQVLRKDREALADKMGIPVERVDAMAGDYRRRALRAARDAGADRQEVSAPKMGRILDRFRAERNPTPLLDDAANQAATSPKNTLVEPSLPQKEAGNYKLGHAKLGGHDFSIENPAGSERKGVDGDGKEWSVKMKSHYGYIKGTVGRDKDHIDAFIKPGTEQLTDQSPMFVVDQVDQDGKFDEHKVMVGFETIAEARKAYMENYTKGWTGLGAITEAPNSEFKEWLANGNTKQPFAKPAKTPSAEQVMLPAETRSDDGVVNRAVSRLVDDGLADAAPLIDAASGDISDADLSKMFLDMVSGASTMIGDGFTVEPKPAAVMIGRDGAEKRQRVGGKTLANALRSIAKERASKAKPEPSAPTAKPTPERFVPADMLRPQDQKTLAKFRDSDAGEILAELDQLARRATYAMNKKGVTVAQYEAADFGRSLKKGRQEADMLDQTIGTMETLLKAVRDAKSGEYDGEVAEAIDQAREFMEEFEAMGIPIFTWDAGEAEYNGALAMERDPMPDAEIFPKPDGKTVNVVTETKGKEPIPQDEADAEVQRWKDIAKRVGQEKDKSKKVIVSLFDYTGAWSQPWADAGYNVIRHDIKSGSNILIDELVYNEIEELRGSGMEVVGVLSACPCTTFAGSGARWWKDLHDVESVEALQKVFGKNVPRLPGVKSPKDFNVALVDATRDYIREANPSRFHVLENPIGRIQEAADMPQPLMRFNPNVYGDPYTKLTQLFGTFDTDLPQALVEPVDGSKVQSKLRGDDPLGKEKRSTTPDGFAYAFFIANDPDAKAMLAEKAPSVPARRATDIGNPMTVRMGNRSFPFTSYKEVSEAFMKTVEATDATASGATGPQAIEPQILDGQGNVVAHVSYNGKVWPGASWEQGAKALYEPSSAPATTEKSAKQLRPDRQPSYVLLDDRNEMMLNDTVRRDSKLSSEFYADFELPQDHHARIANHTLTHYAGVYGVEWKGRSRGDVWADMQAKGAVSRQSGSIIANDLPVERIPDLIKNSFRVGSGDAIKVPDRLFNDFVAALRANLDRVTTRDNWGFNITAPVGGETGDLHLANYGPEGLLVTNYSTRRNGSTGKVIGGNANRKDVTTFLKAFINDVDADSSRKAPARGEDKAKPASAKPEPKPDDTQFADNKLFTADKVAEARARLKSKMSQLNSGIDPELLIDGMTIAGAYIESGVRKFGDYATRMVDDFGDGIKPYLLSFYEATRNYPGLDTEGMTPADEAAREHAALMEPGVPESEKIAVGETIKPPRKRARKSGRAEDMRLTDDWGVTHIDGWDAEDERPYGPTKDAFLKEAQAYLKQVAAELEDRGFDGVQSRPDRKGRTKTMKPVNRNDSGVAGSGEVSLHMEHPDTGGVLYANISGSTLRRTVPSTASGVSIMFRVSGEPYGINGGNQWAPVDMTAGELSAKLLSLYDTWLKRRDATTEPPANGIPAELEGSGPSALEGASSGQDRTSGEGRDAGQGARSGGQPDLFGSEPAGRNRDGSGNSVSAGEGEVSVPTGGSSETRPVGSVKTPTTANNQPTEFAISDDDAIGEGGAKTKFRQNVEAIRLIRLLDDEARPATRDEQKTLAKWVGWGGLQQAFYREDGSVAKGWDKQAAELKELLTPDEYDAAMSSTRNAHYTAPEVVKAMWKAVERMGFAGGRVLEPSVGSGNFLGLMPSGARAGSAIVGAELDHITGSIAKNLYPKATIKAPLGFEKLTLPDDTFDLAIGNPPFGSERLYDPNRKAASKFSIHNFFFAKSVDTLKPGGVLAMVVSNFLLDSTTSTAREYLADRADLIGAIRLPNDAFLKNAGTEVTTDIVFLRKRAPGDPAGDRSWTETATFTDKEGREMPLNRYFHDNPDMMLGEFGGYGTMYGRPDNPALISRPGEKLGSILNAAIDKLPADIMRSAPVEQTRQEDVAPKEAADALVNSAFLDSEGNVHVRLADELGEPRSKPIEAPNEKALQRVKGLIRIRDTFTRLRRAQVSESASDEQIANLRERLNKSYDAFVKANGPINLDANKRVFRDDPTWPQLAALEDSFDRGISARVAKNTGEKPRKPSAKKAAIFTKRTQQPYRRPTSAATAKDALAQVLADHNRVDMAQIRRLYPKPEAEILSELGPLVYRMPDGSYDSAEAYLSGNVKKKLAEAIEAAASDPAFGRNVSALQDVIPEDIEAVDINVKPGAPWIPANHMADFIDHITGNPGATATYSPMTAKWVTKAQTATDAAALEYSTDRVGVSQVLDAAINDRQMQVYDKHSDGSSTLNPVATEAANGKVQKVKDAWSEWIWDDDARRAELHRIYNDTYNTDRLREYDGSHLKLPGKVSDDIISLRPHQKNFIWRGLQSSTVLADHTVGAGKTFAAIGLVMEWRRTGTASKPMMVVPNHLVGQWAADFVKLYPGAKVLAPTKADFAADNRKRLFARMATGDYDAIIVAHSTFGRIGVDPEFEAEFIRKQIADIELAETALREAEGKSSRNSKQLTKWRDNLKTKLEKLMDAGRKDEGLTFNEIGIDGLVVDEAHEFKNLAFATSMTRIAGLGNPTGSQKAADLFMKMSAVRERTGGRNLAFLTGTPISNTMAEMFTMQRYLDEDALSERGINHFDAWARVFGEVVTDFELSPAGKYTLKSRFSKFVNMPELIARYRSFADVISNDDIQAMLAAQGKRLPIPKLKGGKPENVVVERSDDQADFIGVPLKTDDQGNDVYPEHSLIYRAENLPKKPEKGADNMLKIMSDARKAALDMRLIDPAYGDNPKSKTNRAADEMLRLYKKWDKDKGTQLVFIDLSTPKGAVAKEKARIEDLVRKAEDGDEAAQEALDKMSPDEIDAINADFDVYNDLKAKLIARGVPEAEIAFIHDANTDLQKEALFGKVRSGQVRFLFGSTAKMGAGTNVQDRLVGLHHLDAPWRPSDMEQREGRIIRQGNMLYARDPDGFEIEINRYATENTLDSRMYQTIEQKATFIGQVRKGASGGREINDIGGEAANAAEMKAAASGNPLILEEVELRKAIRTLDNRKREFTREQFRLQDRIRSMSEERAALVDEKPKAERDAENAPVALEAGGMTVDGEFYKKQGDAGGAMIDRLLEMVNSGARSIEVGQYGPFRISGALTELSHAPVLVVHGEKTRFVTIDDLMTQSAAGLGQKLRNTVNAMISSPRDISERLSTIDDQLPKLKSRRVDTFPEAEELAAKVQRHREVLDILKPKPKPAAPKEGAAETPPDDAQMQVNPWDDGFDWSSDQTRLTADQQQELADIIKTVAGDGVDVRFADTIKVPSGHRGLEAWGETAGGTAAGMYLAGEPAIVLALDSATRGAAYHEAFHHVQRAFLTDAERAILTDRAERLRAIIGTNPFRANQVERMDQKELEAEAFATWANAKTADRRNIALPAKIRTAWGKIKRMVERVRNALKGWGFKTVEDIFENAARGGAARRRSNGRGGGTSFQAAPPVFYSALTQAVGRAKQKKGGTGQWMGIIRNTPGVKPEEIEWSGVADWLKSQTGPVTREALVDYLRANETVVDETVLEPGSFDEAARIWHDVSPEDWADMTDDERAVFRTEYIEEADDSFRDAHESMGDDQASTRYDAYTLEGGAGYRELLIKLPRSPERYWTAHYEGESNVVAHVRFNERSRNHQDPEALERYTRERADFEKAHAELRKKHGPLMRQARAERIKLDRAEKTEVIRRAKAGETTYAAAVQALNEIDGKRHDTPLQRSYRDAMREFADLRSPVEPQQSDRRVLFIEEVQSDWHQDGRRSGYQGAGQKIREETGKEVRELLTAHDDLGFESETEAISALLSTDDWDKRWGIPEMSAEERDLLARYRTAWTMEGNVPQAPFKTSWPELAFKRMIRWAAEHGYDEISWTPGEVQADRYDLSTRVDSIDFKRIEGTADQYEIAVFDKGFDRTPDEAAGPQSAQDLEKLFGKDIARKIVDGATADFSTIEGADLRIGGEGMVGFYDKILPAAVNKLVKKWGAKVTTSQIEVKGKKVDVWTVEMTDAMRDAAQAGLPMFQINPRPQDMRPVPSPTRDGILDAITSKFTDLQPAMLALVPMNYFEELRRPSMTAIKDYLSVKRAMDAYRGDRHSEANDVAQKWLSVIGMGIGKGRNNPVAQDLADLMHRSTLAGVDPSKSEQEDHPAYAALRSKYEALPKKAQALYREVRDSYAAQSTELDKILLDNVRKAFMIAEKRAEEAHHDEIERINKRVKDPVEAAALKKEADKTYNQAARRAHLSMKARMTKLRIMFESSRVPPPYFPLSRFGRYFVSVRDDMGELISFSKRESHREAKALAAEMRQQFPDAEIDMGVMGEKTRARDQMDPRLLSEIEGILGESAMSSPEMMQVMDQIWQRYLDTMPDLSVRKRFIHRSGVAGFDRDALRAYSTHMFHAAHQMARLKYGMELTELTRDVSNQARRADKPVPAMNLANELKKRHEWVMNPTGSTAAQTVTSTAFVWYLGTTPAAAMVNLTQTVMMGVPVLGGRYGIGKAAAAIAKASADSVRGYGLPSKNPNLTDDEARAMAIFYRSGLVDRTQSHDLAGVGDTGVRYSPVRQRMMGVVSWAFHNAERWNREVTALAAYRLARDASSKDEFTTQHMAIDAAHELTWKTHFDYSNSSRPRFMQNDAMKVAMVFRAHNINMLYRLGRDIHQSLKGETKQARREARLQLAGIFGMQALMAGVTGLAGFNLAMAVMGMFLQDDDDPFDYEMRFRQGVTEALGPELGGVVLNGAPGHYTGLSLTNRIGMPDLWFRSPNRDLEGRDEFNYWVLNAAGASVSMLGDLYRGVSLVRDGETVKGVEAMSPKFVKDQIRAYRYANEGVTDFGGNEVLSADQLDAMDIVAQSIGFSPAKVSERWDRNTALKNADSRIQKKRSRLLADYALAHKMGDDAMKDEVLSRIRRFNDYPLHRGKTITPKTIRQSLRQRQRLAAKRQDGVLIQNERVARDLREQLPEPIY